MWLNFVLKWSFAWDIFVLSKAKGYDWNWFWPPSHIIALSWTDRHLNFTVPVFVPMLSRWSFNSCCTLFCFQHMKNEKEKNTYDGWPELITLTGCIPKYLGWNAPLSGCSQEQKNDAGEPCHWRNLQSGMWMKIFKACVICQVLCCRYPWILLLANILELKM